MFTGLVDEVGTVRGLRPGPTTRLEVTCSYPPADLELGESIAVDGCCLTVVEIGSGWVGFDASDETLRRTVLGSYRHGTRVHLERALAVGDRLGGHIVQGHVDATSNVLRRWSEGGSVWMEVGLPTPLAPFFIEKGSVAVDGVSLTVNTLQADRFGLTLIPESQARTALAQKPIGAQVNLEADLVGKYIARMASIRVPGTVDEAFLRRAGFGAHR